MTPSLRSSLLLALVVLGCAAPPVDDVDASSEGDGAMLSDAGSADASTTDAAPLPCTGALGDCAAMWEQNTSDHLDAITSDPVALAAFLRAVPKGGDLHNHLTGAVYAETYLEWAHADGDCIVPTTHAAVYSSMCSATNQLAPTSGAFYDEIVAAWSMQGFVPGGAESGHDHFFATFAKYGAVAGAHRDEDIADVLIRAQNEHQLYVETMFNLGKDVGTLSASLSSGTVTAASLPALYATLHGDPGFAAALASDVATVRSAGTGWRGQLGCTGPSPDPACDVGVRFIAQVSRTGANDTIFGQLVSAFEMAAMTPEIVGVNLSSPEDDSRSLTNYDLHMAMLDFLHTQYTTSGTSPLHVTLHAGELTPAFLPAGSTDNTFHIRHAVETGHAERIGHGLDLASETDHAGLLAEMSAGNVLVEVCLSSNDQILEVRGTAHPLATYLASGVPVALATDDQGVSRSSMAGEYLRAIQDQHLTYRQLKTMARQSLEHSFLPGTSLWSSVTTGTMVAACTPLADPPSASCQAVLDASERARMQWALEQNFLAFERTQPAP